MNTVEEIPLKPPALFSSKSIRQPPDHLSRTLTYRRLPRFQDPNPKQEITSDTEILWQNAISKKNEDDTRTNLTDPDYATKAPVTCAFNTRQQQQYQPNNDDVSPQGIGKETRYVKQGNAKADWWLQARSRLNRQFDIETDRKLTFTDHKFAFQSKTTAELLRASLCFNLFSIKYLVENNEKIMAVMSKVLGEKAFHALMKATVYGQFVAGEDKDKIKGCVERLTGAGVGSILDYAVEEDIDEDEAVELEMDSCLSTEEHLAEIGDLPSQSFDKNQDDKLKFRTPSQYNDYEMYRAHKEFADRRMGVTSARTYFYKDEEKCDKYMEHFLYCINAAGGASDHGFAAIKLTALGRPQFLLQFSDALVSSRQLFEELAGATKDINAQKSVLELGFDESRFIDKAGRMGLARSRGDLLETFTFMREEADSEWIDLLDWNNLMDRNKSFGDIFVIDNNGETVRLMKDLTTDEEDQMKRMLERINTLASEAKRQGVRLMIDAEQTYFQPAISRIAVECMREFNNDNPVIFNTYQCYLKQAFKNFVIDLEQCRIIFNFL
ncbi:Oidioi.mRNA.OKI2018_I69.XSR.g14260.t3.cds [Oikopleura dioica]|uniref:Proline dehydrogenase n=1 Tax=Oikopleura dioica TaxID=34765 RepID=A0ABN7SEJ1_OIKDI|nr:Oidioi.mRNA.OKI2018_I69.XSR.g14260.t3.cds [Oikopleura dioica]